MLSIAHSQGSTAQALPFPLGSGQRAHRGVKCCRVETDQVKLYLWRWTRKEIFQNFTHISCQVSLSVLMRQAQLFSLFWQGCWKIFSITFAHPKLVYLPKQIYSWRHHAVHKENEACSWKKLLWALFNSLPGLSHNREWKYYKLQNIIS